MVITSCCVSMSVRWGKGVCGLDTCERGLGDALRETDTWWYSLIPRNYFFHLFHSCIHSSTSPYILVWPTSLMPSRYITYFLGFMTCSGSTDTLSIPLFAFPPPPCSKRGSIHSSIWTNQVWIELTAVCQSFLALRLQICDLYWCLLGIFNSNINTRIVSCKYIKCHCWSDSGYWLQPPSLNRHTSFEEKKPHAFLHFLFYSDILQQRYGGNKELIPIDLFLNKHMYSFLPTDILSTKPSHPANSWVDLWRPMLCVGLRRPHSS